MTSVENSKREQTGSASLGLLARLRSNTRGSTAIEFAMVGLPFLMLLFGTMLIGLFFFTTFALENAVERAGRLILTRQVSDTNMSEAVFKTEVCNRAPVFVDCRNNLKVYVQSFLDNAASFTPRNCLNPAGTALNPASEFDPGDVGEIVMVTACYEWELTAAMPMFNLGNMGASRHRLIQATTIFRVN